MIGCDGIKSFTRAFVLDKIAPEAIQPQFAHEYAYRMLFSREEADQLFGHDVAGQGTIWFAKDGYMVTYPVDVSPLFLSLPSPPLTPTPS